jgi:hypothetical protein
MAKQPLTPRMVRDMTSGVVSETSRKVVPRMAKAAPKLTKVVAESNLVRLGADRLAGLLMEAAAADPGFKRRLRLELAAEIGAPDLALELDKRLKTLAESRARVSWRKRPDLIRELRSLRDLIIGRLAEADVRLAFDRLIVWFDLLTPLNARTKDPKGEMALVFDEAAPALARIASAVGPDIASPVLIEALMTRSTPWASFVGRGVSDLSPALARRLLKDLTASTEGATGRIALVMRKLADRTGDLDAWLAALREEDRRQPAVAAEIARRLAVAGRVAEARAALDAAARGPEQKGGRRWIASTPPPAPDEAWHAAEIAVLDAEGRDADALDARWRRFERTVSVEDLRELISHLPDFEDVVATDRAVAFAAGYFDLMKGLAFLMDQGALREAAEAVVARPSDLRGNVEETPLWASRLAGRFPLAALLLLRARAEALVRLGGVDDPETATVLHEAEALAADLPDADLPSHAAFVASLTPPPKRRGWR